MTRRHTHSPHRSLREDDEGAIAVEYVAILVLVAILGISAWASYERAVRDDAQQQYQTFGYPP